MTESIANIIERAKKRASVPDGSPTYQAASLLNFAQESLDEIVFPWLYGINEDFSLVVKTVPLSSSGTVLYPLGDVPIPARCYGRSLTELKYIDPSGNLYNMPLVNLADQDLMQRNPGLPTLYQGAPAFFLRGDVIHLCARMESLSGSLVITFPVKIPTLSASTTLHAEITSVVYSSGTTTFTVATPGADFNTYCADTNPDTSKRFDIFRRTSGQYTNIDVICTRTGATTLTTTDISQDEATTLATYQQGGFTNISYYNSDLILLPAEQNNYSPIPQELDNYFVMAVADRYLESVGDVEGLQVSQAKMAKEEKNAAKALAKRVIHEAKTISNRRGIRAFFTPVYIRRT